MINITLRIEDFRDPFDSTRTLVREEDAAHCDGGPCSTSGFLDGELIEPDPHHHTVISGEDPKASPRYLAVFLRSSDR